VNSDEHRALMAAFSEILTTGAYERLREFYTPDVVVEFPQSGERFRGPDGIIGQFQGYPGHINDTQMSDVIGGTAYALTPMYTVVAVEGSGDNGTAIYRTRYPDGSMWWVINLYELRDRRVAKVRTFFAPDFEAPGWREPFWDKG
jgi:hypothetical protein